MRKYSENIMKIVFLTAACVSIIAVILICVFLFASGVPAIKEIGVSDFLLGDSWKPNQDLYGVFPMIIGSVYVTAGAILIGVPIGLLCAVFMARYCPKRLYRVLKPAVDLLAGIPSIVYGFFGLMVIVPLVQGSLGGSGKCLLTSSVLLGIMILPTIISVSQNRTFVLFRNTIMKVPWHWGLREREASSVLCFRLLKWASWPGSSWGSEERSVKPWQSLWSAETRRSCRMV